MRISEFLEETGMKPSHFCKKVGISTTALYNILAGDVSPRLKHAISIHVFTDKKVKYEDMLAESDDADKANKRKKNNQKIDN
jgi:predicted transcriptional regulator